MNGRIAFTRHYQECAVSGTDVCFESRYRIDTLLPNGLGRRTIARRALSPAFSPDGGTIAFLGKPRAVNSPLYTQPIDQSRARQAVRGIRGDDLAWSPNGRRLAVSTYRRGRDRIIVANRSGGSSRFRATGWGPTWSVRGTLAFVAYTKPRERYTSPVGIYLLRPHLRSPHLLRAFPPDQPPAALDWSPHGDRLAFAAPKSIYTIRSNGTGLRRLIRGSHDHPAESPAWSPDGRRIAYVQRHDIYVARANGRARQRILDGDREVDYGAADEVFLSISDLDWQAFPRR